MLRPNSLWIMTRSSLSTKNSAANAYQMMNEHVTTEFFVDNELRVARNFYLVVVEAFRFDDVVAIDKKAHCVWAVFVAVPVDEGQKFSDVLPAMLQTATPYFGETTHGHAPDRHAILRGNDARAPDTASAGWEGDPRETRSGTLEDPRIRLF